MPIQTPRTCRGTQGVPGRDQRRAPLLAQRGAPPHISWDGAQTPSVSDTFAMAEPESLLNRARTGVGPSLFARRRRQWHAPQRLHDTLGPNGNVAFETEQADNGQMDVVDCELIASRQELKRWRLSLTDFHALLAGGTESIEAYRNGQRRRESALAEAAQRADALAAAALLDAKNLPTDPLAPADADALPHPEPVHPEPKWWSILAWPYRALKRLAHALLELIG